MKQRDKGKNKHRKYGRPTQKLTDEYTGGPLYSDEAVADYKGVLTNKKMADNKPIPEQKINIPNGAVPWVIRKEVNPVTVTTAQAWDIYWDTFGEKWDSTEFTY